MRIKLPAFANKSDLYDYLIKNKSDIIDLKKSAYKCGDLFGVTQFEENVIKSVNKATNDTDSEIYRTIVGNTYYWLDSHEDVHISGCFAETIKQRGAKRISHLHDHIQQLDAKVGIFTNVYEKAVSWTDLGVNKVGSTEALMADTVIKRSLNDKIFEQYKGGEIDQHSVGMFYDDIKLAINDPDRKEEYAEWLKFIDLLGNRDKAEALGYFWPVYRAKLREISCVLDGSNEITPTLAPLDDRQEGKNDPPAGSQEKSVFGELLTIFN